LKILLKTVPFRCDAQHRQRLNRLAEIMAEFQDDLRASLVTAGLLSSKSGLAIGAARDRLRN
jgi:hypothetical protein